MPELPEVEVLVCALRPLIQGRVIRGVRIHRNKILRPTSPREFERCVLDATFDGLERRGKYLLFRLTRSGEASALVMVGHLGMTGRMYLAPRKATLPRHAALVLELGGENFVFEDTRYFGRMTLDATALSRLGPEPMSEDFTVEYLRQSLRSSSQCIKVKLLDQAVVAGLGNIYASEALFRAAISPQVAARRLTSGQVASLRRAIRKVLKEAIQFGSTVPLSYAGAGKRDGLFYFGAAPGSRHFYEERLHVYDRANHPCSRCGELIRRIVQAGRSTFYCPRCQRTRHRRRITDLRIQKGLD